MYKLAVKKCEKFKFLLNFIKNFGSNALAQFENHNAIDN